MDIGILDHRQTRIQGLLSQLADLSKAIERERDSVQTMLSELSSELNQLDKKFQNK